MNGGNHQKAELIFLTPWGITIFLQKNGGGGGGGGVWRRDGGRFA